MFRKNMLTCSIQNKNGYCSLMTFTGEIWTIIMFLRSSKQSVINESTSSFGFLSEFHSLFNLYLGLSSLFTDFSILLREMLTGSKKSK